MANKRKRPARRHALMPKHDEILVDPWPAALMTGQRAVARRILRALIAADVLSQAAAGDILTQAADDVREIGETLRLEAQAYTVAAALTELAREFIGVSPGSEGAPERGP